MGRTKQEGFVGPRFQFVYWVICCCDRFCLPIWHSCYDCYLRCWRDRQKGSWVHAGAWCQPWVTHGWVLWCVLHRGNRVRWELVHHIVGCGPKIISPARRRRRIHGGPCCLSPAVPIIGTTVWVIDGWVSWLARWRPLVLIGLGPIPTAAWPVTLLFAATPCAASVCIKDVSLGCVGSMQQGCRGWAEFSMGIY